MGLYGVSKLLEPCEFLCQKNKRKRTAIDVMKTETNEEVNLM